MYIKKNELQRVTNGCAK